MHIQRKIRRTKLMKTSLLLRTLLLACTLAGSAARAADPQPATAVPDVAKLLAMLNQLAAEADVPVAAADPAPAPAPAPPAPEPAAAVPTPAPRPASRLITPQLRGATLTPSGALGGRGPGATVPVTESAWRALFPLKQPRN